MSRLGDLDYWEDIYLQSLCLNGDEIVDTNEWFIKEGNMVIEKLLEIYPEEKRQKIKILDVGCGSGEFLCKLYLKGFTNLFGFDYSPNSIVLAKKNAEKANFQINFINIDVEHANELFHNGSFDVVIDKGTFDIFFCTNRVSAYTKNILPLIATSGRYFIVSCNTVISELIASFDNVDGIKLELQHQFDPVQTFVFGNKQGRNATSAMFKLVHP